MIREGNYVEIKKKVKEIPAHLKHLCGKKMKVLKIERCNTISESGIITDYICNECPGRIALESVGFTETQCFGYSEGFLLKKARGNILKKIIKIEI